MNGTRGWTSLLPGAPWVASSLEVTAGALVVRQDAAPGEFVVRLADVAGVDQLSADADGTVVLELVVTGGAVAHLRVDADFVDALVAALRAPDPEPAHDPDPDHAVDDPPPPRARSNNKGALQAEIAELREYLDGLGFPERRALRADVDTLLAHRADALAELRAVTRQRRDEEIALVRVRREVALQDVGIYRPRHPAEDGPALRERLDDVQRRIEQLVDAGGCVTTTDDWTVNGSRAEGRKVVDELGRLLLRTYNAEADLLVSTIRAYELDAAVDRLGVTRATIHRLGVSMSIEISDELHDLRVEELTLAADQAAFEDRVRRRPTEPPPYPGAPRYVVVTSNLGAFGPDVVRIGLTRHADEADAVDEADGGRLPFRSDLHALVDADDPEGLLAELRSRFAGRRLDLSDPAAVFFRVALAEVRDALVESATEVPRFVAVPLAEHWRQSENARHEHEQ